MDPPLHGMASMSQNDFHESEEIIHPQEASLMNKQLNAWCELTTDG
jgi:hypothetical protein